MGDRVTFDAVAKTITIFEAPVGGFTTLDAQIDLYSDAKEDWKNDATLNKFAFPFTTIGGNDLGGGVYAGAYYFLDNVSGWRILPYESSHVLQIDGNLYPLNPAIPIIQPTAGSFTVVVKFNLSSLTQSVTGGGGGGGAIADAILTEMVQDNGSGVSQFTANALALAPVGGGASPSGRWKFDTGTATPAGTGDVRINNASTALATEIFINETTDNGGDATPYLSALGVGDSVFLYQDDNAANFLKMVVATPPADNGASWTIAGSLTDFGGTFGNNKVINVTLLTPGVSAGDIASAVWEENILNHLTSWSAGITAYLGQTPAIDTVLTGTPTATEIELTAGSAVDDFYNDQVVFVFTAGGAQARPILAYDGATKTITVDEPWEVVPSSGDRAAVVLSHQHPISQISAKVWDEVMSTHLTAGTAGAYLGNLNTKVDALYTLFTTARGEPAGGSLPVSATTEQKIDYMFKHMRNKKDATGIFNQYYNAAGDTVDQKQTTNESGGIVTVGPITGP